MRKLLTVLFLLMVTLAAAQKPSLQDAPNTCGYSELYNASGWTVPGLKGAKVQGKGGHYPDLPGVVSRWVVPHDRQSNIAYYHCSRDHGGRLEVGINPIGILQMIRFEIAGRVFAYYVRFGNERIENGKRVDGGTESQLIYYDLGGSGRFTLRKQTMIPQPAFIPDWVRKDK